MPWTSKRLVKATKDRRIDKHITPNYEKTFSSHFDNGRESGIEHRDLCRQLGGGPNHGYHCGSGSPNDRHRKKGRWYFKSDLDPKSLKLVKVGEKVTVHYYITGRGNVYAKKIDKAGQDHR